MATQPSNAPENAVCIPPGVTQRPTLVNIQAQIVSANWSVRAMYAYSIYAWSYNAMVNESLGIALPPFPPRPAIQVGHVIWADVNGKEVKPIQAVGGDYYAWAWQTAELMTLEPK